jgi:hypothetical protein
MTQPVGLYFHFQLHQRFYRQRTQVLAALSNGTSETVVATPSIPWRAGGLWQEGLAQLTFFSRKRSRIRPPNYRNQTTGLRRSRLCLVSVFFRAQADRR